MNIWLVYPNGALPGEGLRPDRAFMISEALVSAGHEVTWWASLFNHNSKKFRSKEDIVISPKFTIRPVQTSAYKNHISFKRIQSENEYARQVYLNLQNYNSPDIIIMSDPALFRSRSILKLVKETNALLILDILDLWPELFNIIFPKYFAKVGNILFAPLYLRRKSLFRKADAIFAVSESYLDLAKKIAPNLTNEYMSTVYFGINLEKFRSVEKKSASAQKHLQNITRNNGELLAIYASSLGSNYDLKTLLESMTIIEKRKLNLKVLIAGTGPLEDYIINFIKEKGLKQLIYIGNPDLLEMISIFSHCDMGLSMYVKGSTVTMPIKAYNYFAAGLPIVNSLEGELSDFLVKYDAGLNFEPENVQSLVEVLQLICSNPIKLKTMAKNSYNLASLFDEKKQYTKVIKIVDKLLIKNKNI
jgi:glycosyltransferase involved in cell wall biosynthesis